jgi:Na+-driven multidrug efflux pump
MKDLTTGKESKLILEFAAPMLLGTIFQQLFSIVDSIVVGNFIGKEALAAVGASFPVIFVMVSMIIGLVMGTTVVISQYFGAGDIARVKKAIDTMYIYSAIAGVISTIVGLIIAEPF